MELKDYLHLYLGCEVYRERYPKQGIHVLVGVDNTGYYIRWNNSTPFFISAEHEVIKPILRPLSDMTQEEKAIARSMKTNPEEIRFYLSKHFDLFNLIEAGLAINKATL